MERTLRQTTLQRQVGTVAEYDLLRSRVALDGQRPLVIQARQNREVATLRLKQLLNLPLTEPIALATPIQDADMNQVLALSRLDNEVRPSAGTGLSPTAISTMPTLAPRDTAPEARSAVQQAIANVEVQKGALENAGLQRMPSLNLTTNYQRFGYPTNAQIIPRSLADLYPGWTVSLGLSVPIWTSGRITGDQMVARANLQDAQARLSQGKRAAALDVQLALRSLEQAEANWLASIGTEEQADKALRIAEVRYTNGISTQLELSDIRNLLIQSQANRLTAAKDLQLARASHDTASGSSAWIRWWRGGSCRRRTADADPDAGHHHHQRAVPHRRCRTAAMIPTTSTMTQTEFRALRAVVPARRTVAGLLLVGASLGIAACGKKEAPPAAKEEATLITTDNMAIADTARIASGPSISGELTAERSASVRAEVSGSVMQVFVEPGQRVAAGASLARIDATTAAAAELSARTGVTASEASSAQAKKELDRAERLNAAGAIADRDLENARLAYSTAMAQLANVKSAYAAANKQLRSATVRAPFAGVIAGNVVSAGDVVSPGTQLFTVVDPKSMRLEAAVPRRADRPDPRRDACRVQRDGLWRSQVHRHRHTRQPGGRSHHPAGPDPGLDSEQLGNPGGWPVR